MADRASIVLITFDSAAFLPRCLEGIKGQRGVEVELIHVDNASRDASVALVDEEHPPTRQFLNRENLGFAAAANQGIRAAQSDFVLLLNPDVFLEPDYLSRVITAIRTDDRIGTAAGKLLQGKGAAIDPTGFVDSVGIRMTRTGRHLDEGNGEPDRWLQREPFEVFGVSGAAMVLRRSFIEDVAIEAEIFDERFFAYREDADLAWRGQILGWKSLCVPMAVGYHVRTVTPAVRSKIAPILNMHSVKNRFLLRVNNQGAEMALRHFPFQLFRDLVVIGAVMLREPSSLPALSWLWRNRSAIIARRKAIQARRRVSDQALAKWFR